MDIVFFDDKIEKFISSLEKSTIAKVLRTLDLLEKFGNRLGMPHSKPMRDGLFELRVRGKQEVRIMYIFRGKKILLLHAFLKRTNKTSSKDSNVAFERKRLLDRG